MKLGLYAPARSLFVLAGPMAQAAIKRGHDVVFVRDASRALKPGDTWTDNEIQQWWPDALVQEASFFEGDWLAGPARDCDRVQRLWRVSSVHANPTKLAALDAWFDSLARPFSDGYDLTHRTVRHGLIPTDGLVDVEADDRRDLLWFPPKTMIPGAAQRAVRWVLVCGLAWVLHRAARRAGRRLIVKTRSKMRLPHVVTRLADRIVMEGPLYPHASLSEIASASLVVCHQSAAGFEAVAAGVRCLSVRLPQWHLRTLGNYALLRAARGSPYAWPGVIDALGVENAVRWIEHWTPDRAPDWDQRAAYIDTWCGGRVQGTSDWVVDDMERRS